MLAPEEVCRRYRAAGYDFLALTDHFIGAYGYPIADTVPYRTNQFTTLLGAEVHAGAMANGELWHILAVGLPPDFAPPHAPGFVPVADQESGPDLAARARAAGAFVAVAHPHWSGLSEADALLLSAAHAVEAYNHGCAVGCDRGEGFHTLDLLLSAGRDVSLIATDDAHFSEPDHFGGWVMVKAEANEPDALLAALKAGAYYSSQGPDLRSVRVVDGQVEVACSPAARVMLQGHGSAAAVVHGTAMTEATLSLDALNGSPWVRVTVADAAGRRAWANPIRLG